MKNQKHVFAIVRVDEAATPTQSLENRITIKEILTAQADAELEVTRLNNLNSSKGCVYFWQITRLVGEANQTKQD